MPKLKPLGRYESALSTIAGSRNRELSTARKILTLLAPLDTFEADNALDIVEEIRCQATGDELEEETDTAQMPLPINAAELQ